MKQHIPTLSDEETIFPYKRIEAISRRVSRASLKRIEDMTAKYHNAEVWPASWWRDTKTLMAGTRHKAGQQAMTALSQELFVMRVLKEAPGQHYQPVFLEDTL